MNRSLFNSLAAALCIALSAAALPCVSSFAQNDDKKPAQAEVASKSAKFATIAATSPLVKKAIPATQLAAVQKLVGKSATLVGTIDKVFVPRSHKVVVLNFAKDYKTAAQAALKSENYAAFPDMKTLKGKKVVVTGTVSEYRSAVQIDLSKPSQLQIVK